MKPSVHLQLHILTAYAPSNLNRDDMGRPKTAIVGGVQRLRVSSQSLKRAWRTSPVFASRLEGHIGTRTKHVGRYALEALEGVDTKLAKQAAKDITAQFGKLKKDKQSKEEIPETEQLVHVSPAEIEAIRALAGQAAAGEDIKGELPKLLGRAEGVADIALFGRMLADSPQHNVEAAAQVGHAFTVHRGQVEDDYFTAVDDLSTDAESGASHIGVSEFGSGVYYLYLCVNRSELKQRLGDEGLTAKTLSALVEAAATVGPRGKIASFGSSARASYVLAERGTSCPRSLMSAFVKPMEGKDGPLALAIDALKQTRTHFDQVYGPCADAVCEFNVPEGTGSLTEVLSFTGSGL